MPKSTSHPLFKWHYTALDDDTFSDGRTPDAVTLVAAGPALPKVVTQGPTPSARGPWWLPQDLAHGGDLVPTVLRVSKLLGTLPVLDARLLLGVEAVDQISTYDIRVPVLAIDSATPTLEQVRRVRTLIRDLILEADPAAQIRDVSTVATAISDLHYESPNLPHRSARLVLLRTRRPAAGTHSSEWQLHPAILVDSRAAEVLDNPSFPSVEPEGREPIRLQGAAGLRRLGLIRASRGDMDGATRFLRSAADHGDADAMVDLGHISRRAPGPEYLDAAYHWFKSAAALDHGPATFLAGLIQAERGEFGEREGADVWWERAAERGIPEAATLLGNRQMERGETAAAEQWWRRATELGDAKSAMNMGLLRSKSSPDWFEDDGPDSAEAWWQRAFALGSPRAPSELARRRMHLGELNGDDGVESWLLRGTEAGDPEAMFGMGLLRQTQGDIVGPDGALLWFLRAESTGSVRAGEAIREMKEQAQRASDPGSDSLVGSTDEHT